MQQDPAYYSPMPWIPASPEGDDTVDEDGHDINMENLNLSNQYPGNNRAKTPYLADSTTTSKKPRSIPSTNVGSQFLIGSNEGDAQGSLISDATKTTGEQQQVDSNTSELSEDFGYQEDVQQEQSVEEDETENDGDAIFLSGDDSKEKNNNNNESITLANTVDMTIGGGGVGDDVDHNLLYPTQFGYVPLDETEDGRPRVILKPLIRRMSEHVQWLRKPIVHFASLVAGACGHKINDLTYCPLDTQYEHLKQYIISLNMDSYEDTVQLYHKFLSIASPNAKELSYSHGHKKRKRMDNGDYHVTKKRRSAVSNDWNEVRANTTFLPQQEPISSRVMPSSATVQQPQQFRRIQAPRSVSHQNTINRSLERLKRTIASSQEFLKLVEKSGTPQEKMLQRPVSSCISSLRNDFVQIEKCFAIGVQGKNDNLIDFLISEGGNDEDESFLPTVKNPVRMPPSKNPSHTPAKQSDEKKVVLKEENDDEWSEEDPNILFRTPKEGKTSAKAPHHRRQHPPPSSPRAESEGVITMMLNVLQTTQQALHQIVGLQNDKADKSVARIETIASELRKLTGEMSAQKSSLTGAIKSVRKGVLDETNKEVASLKTEIRSWIEEVKRTVKDIKKGMQNLSLNKAPAPTTTFVPTIVSDPKIAPVHSALSNNRRGYHAGVASAMYSRYVQKIEEEIYSALKYLVKIRSHDQTAPNKRGGNDESQRQLMAMLNDMNSGLYNLVFTETMIFAIKLARDKVRYESRQKNMPLRSMMFQDMNGVQTRFANLVGIIISSREYDKNSRERRVYYPFKDKEDYQRKIDDIMMELRNWRYNQTAGLIYDADDDEIVDVPDGAAVLSMAMEHVLLDRPDIDKKPVLDALLTRKSMSPGQRRDFALAPQSIVRRLFQ